MTWLRNLFRALERRQRQRLLDRAAQYDATGEHEAAAEMRRMAEEIGENRV